jgi:nudix-type nucleoside diphosphatase (YffH/AdpP family)
VFGLSERIVIHEKTVLASDWGTLTRYVVEHDSLAGEPGRHVREVYDHGNAAAVILYDPAHDRVALVRQFRLPPHFNGDAPRLIEVCAGLLDGDPPEVCARREAEEETGYVVEDLKFICEAYVSPGSLTEKLYCFAAAYRSEDRHGHSAGLAEEGEDIEILEIGLDEALAMIGRGEIVDAKTILMLFWLNANKGWAD